MKKVKVEKSLSFLLALIMALSCLSAMTFCTSAAPISDAVKANVINADINTDTIKKLPEDICNGTVETDDWEFRFLEDNITIFSYDVISLDDKTFISTDNIVVKNLPDNCVVNSISPVEALLIDGKYYFEIRYTNNTDNNRYNYAYAYTEDFTEFYYSETMPSPDTKTEYVPGFYYSIKEKNLEFIGEIDGKYYFDDWGIILYTTDFESFTEVEFPEMGSNKYVTSIENFGEPRIRCVPAENGYIVYKCAYSDFGVPYVTFDRMPFDFYYTEDFIEFTKIDASVFSGFYGNMTDKYLGFRVCPSESKNDNSLFITVYNFDIVMNDSFGNDIDYTGYKTCSYIFDKEAKSFVKIGESDKDLGLDYLSKDCRIACSWENGIMEYAAVVKNEKETRINIKELNAVGFNYFWDFDPEKGATIDYFIGITTDGKLWFTKDFQTIVNYNLPVLAEGEKINGLIYTNSGNNIISTYIKESDGESTNYVYYNYLINRDLLIEQSENIIKDYYKGFPDVKQGEWFYDVVKYNAQKGFITGYQNGNFGPNDSLKRQDFVCILARIAGADLSKYENVQSKLTDVKKGDYYAAAVNWAVDKGYISGYQNGKFGVNDSITREQVATILYNYMNKPEVKDAEKILSKFPDANKVSSFAKTPVAWAVSNGVISGMGNGTVASTSGATRAQIAAIIQRMDTQGMFSK